MGYSEPILAISIAYSGSFNLPIDKLKLSGENNKQTPTVIKNYHVGSHQSNFDRLLTRFMQLAEDWRKNTAIYSSLDRIVSDPTYLQIIGMGRPIIPILLSELVKHPDHWFAALSSITGQDPVLTEHHGNLNAMAKDWIQWGESEEYC